MKKILNISEAPKAIGPYSQAVKCGNFLFISGQIPVDPATQALIGGDIGAMTERVMENIKALLNAAGMDFSHVVKTTIFLADMNDFAAVNETYGKYFLTGFPARETVQVSCLPKDAKVEISAIACAD